MGTPEHELVIRAHRAVLPGGEASATVCVRGGTITAVLAHDAPVDAAREVVLGDDEVLLPGLVDSHVHVNEPGRTDWEGFASATRAAAAGGVTTIIDMPLNSIPPTVDVAALAVKRDSAAPSATVDVGFWGGAVPGNLPELAPLHAAGVFGFKCFLLDSGVPEFPPLAPDELEAALTEVARLDGLVLVHAEDAQTIEAAPEPTGTRYAGFLASRPRSAEARAIARVVEASRRTGCRVHVLHLSDADALPGIAAARAEGVRITVETCPHYLDLTAEQVPDGATAFKCCPPIREAANRDALWQGLADGLIDAVVSDHSPSTVDLKLPPSGHFGRAWGGIASLQLGLPIVWTQARRRGLGLADVVRWMAAGPAALTGLTDRGAIAVGAQADFCVLAPEATFVVDVHALAHRNPVSAYDGRTLHGVVRSTWLRGEQVGPGTPPRGRLLTRPGG